MPESEGSVNAQSHESPADPTHPRDVFVSYASPDVATANAAVESLEHRGIACWIAPRDVVPGSLRRAARCCMSHHPRLTGR
jgi:hypothetical protein